MHFQLNIFGYFHYTTDLIYHLISCYYFICSYFVFVRVRQSLGGLGAVWKLNVEAQDVALSVSVRVMLSYGLMEACSFLTAPRVAELIVTQRSLKVS